MHIALLTLKETIEGEMNGDTVEIGEFVRYHTLDCPANGLSQESSAHQQTTSSATKA